MSDYPPGSTAKVYYDIENNPRSLFWMVRNEFDWAASRIIEGEKAIAENTKLRKVAIKLYNLGYHSGHEDTVEGCYTHIYQQDMDEYHDDVVADILKDEGVTV